RRTSASFGKSESEMNDNKKTRGEVLSAIRLALRGIGRPQAALPIVDNKMIFKKQAESVVDGFTRVFTDIDGQVIRCENDSQLAVELKALLKCRGYTNIS